MPDSYIAAESGQQFLSDKFAPAILPEIYAPRHELISAFHSAAAGRFIYAGAPTGSGKTVSALLWLLASGRHPIWISLDEYDNAPAVFYKLLATGFFSLQPENEGMKVVLTDTAFSASPVEHTVALLSEMQPADGLYALILDDFHLVTNREVLKSLPAVLRRLSRSFVTVILSRYEPPEALSDLIKEESIITPERLRFSVDEISQYFGSLGNFLPPDEAQFAYLATNGWAIGVSVIAKSGQISIATDGDKRDAGKVFAHYLENHIWNTWDERTRDFCLKTSVVDEFTPDFARRLTGYEDTPEMMERFVRSNAFISHLREDVYRFHHLFREFLRDKVRHLGLDVSALYKTAAEYYRDNEDYATALRFRLDSGDYKSAEAYLYQLIFESKTGTLAEYLNYMRTLYDRNYPDSAFEDLPSLHITYAQYCFVTGQYKEYEKHLDAIRENIKHIAAHDPLFVIYAMQVCVKDHRFDLYERLERTAYLAGLLTPSPEGRTVEINMLSAPYLPGGDEYSDIILLPNDIEESLRIIRGSKAVLLLGDQAEVVFLHASCGCSYLQNDLPAALDKVNRVIAGIDETNEILYRVSAKMLLHSILQNMERIEEADAALDDLSAFVHESAPFFLSNLEAYKTRAAILDCDKSAARAWLDHYYVVGVEYIEFYMVYQHFTTVRAYIVLGDYDGAQKLIGLLRDFGKNMNRTCDYSEASVLLAAFEWAAGKKKEAAALLEDALEKLQPYGFVRPVIDEGAAVLPILKRIAKKTGAKEYRGRLEHGFVNECMLLAYASSKQHKGVTANFIKQQKPVKLSKQQQQIISLLSKGHSNAMITQEMCIKISTLKTYTAYIYDKLGVNNAMDAILKARELGLVE